MDPAALTALLESWGYPLLLTLLLLTGVGSPVPEDLLLVATGYLTHLGVLNWTPAFLISVIGVVGSDVVLYGVGRQVAWRSSRWSERHFLSPDRLGRATRWFDRCGHMLILVARLVPGTRAVVFVTAGVRDVPIARFLGYDVLGALIWVPAMLALGCAMGAQVGDLRALAESVARGQVWLVGGAAALLLLWLSLGREESKL